MTQKAFLTLVVPLQEKLFRFVFHYLRNEEEAKDVVQDALVKLWEKREQLSGVSNPEAWCVRVTKNTMLDKLKYNSYRHTKALDDRHGDDKGCVQPLQTMEINDTVNTVEKIMSELPEKYKLFVQLRDVEGLAYREIADILDLTLAEVKVGIFRARQAIRQQLKNLSSYGLH